MKTSRPEVGKLALYGVAWSAAQNWGGRILTFVLLIVLARFLSPAEFGLVAAALMVFMLIGQVAEFGFGDAIVQRRNYQAVDANLPFMASFAASTLLAGTCALLSGRIETWLEVPGLAPIIVGLVVIAPLTTISQFQEANYRRAFAFQKLAFRVFLANLSGGAVAIAAAVAGAGAWSLVVQTWVATLIGLIWLWSRPIWKPTFEIRLHSFLELARFGLPVVIMRLLDFAATRLFEVMLLQRYGVAVYGLFAAGSRLYQTLMQLLQSALSDVSLTILSRISHDRERVALIYQQTLVMSAIVCAPVFVGCAALVPEISAVLFGSRWAGVEDVARPLLLLGALQSVQFLNGPYLSSRGRTGLVLFVSSLKNIAILLGVIFGPMTDVVGFVQIFAVAQLVGAPFSFGMTFRELRVPALRILGRLLPPVLACGTAYFAVQHLRTWVAAQLLGPLATGLELGAMFLAIYAVVVAATGYRQVVTVGQFFSNRMR